MAPRYTLNAGVQLDEKHKFGSNEIFDEYPKLRQIFLLILASFLLCHLALNVTAPPSSPHLEQPPALLTYILPCLAILFCAFSYYGFSTTRNQSSKKVKIRGFLNFIAALMLACYLALYSSDAINFGHKQARDGDWVSTHTTLSEAFFIVLIFTGLCSTLYFKAFTVAFYYIVVSVMHIEIDNPAFWWVLARNACSCILMIAVLGVQSSLRWKTFVKWNKLEEWNKVYKDILDRNPSCIAVINIAGHIMYSNNGFQDIAQNGPEQFFQGITNLRYRDMLNSSFNLPGGFNHNSNILACPSPLTPISSEESLFKRQNSLHSQRKILRTSTRLRMNTLNSCSNLWQLLAYYRVQLEKETFDQDAQVIFDGKSTGKLNTEPPRTKELGTTERETRRASFTHQLNTYEIIIRPCTEYKKLIVILNNTTERDLIVGLENSSEYKDKILASVSHELRTPLNANLGCLQSALDDSSVPEKVKSSFLVNAFRSGKLLSHVIDDIMDYSQLQTTRLKLKIEPKSIAETLNYCHDLFEQAFKTKHLKLRIKLCPDLPKQFRTDHARIKQIVLNLLSNALKFTLQGGVTIKANYVSGSRIQIKVEDTGLGIKQESLDKIFGEKYPRKSLGFKEVNNTKGAGLGLKISQKLAEMLSDDPDNDCPIQVTSAVGKGSCFVFVIKEINEDTDSDDSNVSVGKVNEQDQDQAADEHSMGSLVESVESQDEVPIEANDDETRLHRPTQDYFSDIKPLRQAGKKSTVFERRRTICTDRGIEQKVLIVDDDPLNILVLESFITQFGMQRDSALNGKEAFDKIMKNPEMYQLILMDCQMPIMDGFETTRLLNSKMGEGELPNIPIVGCTAFSSNEKLKQCIKSGMKEVLPKPVMKDQIGDVLKRYLGVSIR